jgi:HK97 family phage major capsid protein
MLDRLHSERGRLIEQVDDVTNAAEGDERDLSDAELELISRARHRVDDELDPQIERLEEIELARSRHQRATAPAGAVPARTLDVAADVPVYRTFAQYARDELVRRYDTIAQRAGSGSRAQAEERITRAVANTITSDVPGLVPPQYLTDIAQKIDASRPIVQAARSVNLTSGTLVYPSITSRPIVGKQTAEKTESASQKMGVQFVSVTADTYAGSGDLSWQAITWSNPDALGLWFDLAAEAYAIQTEAATGTVLAAATALATPAVPATPALADWIAAITAAAGAIYAASRRRPNTVFADVASGYSIMGLVANVAPVFFPAGDFSLSSGTGNIAGLQLVISGGLPAKTVVVGDSQSLLAAETAGSPVELRAVEPALGGMEVGVIGAFVSKITDAGAFRKLTIT